MIGRITGMGDALAAIRIGADFYLVLGSLLLDKTYEEVTKDERAEVKHRFWTMVNDERRKTGCHPL